MHDTDISTSTPVTHPDGGSYRINIVSGGDEVVNVNITRIGYGHVFTGSPAQAREQGFRFGAEQDAAVADIEALLDPPQPSFAQMQEHLEQATAEIATLKAAAAEREITFTDLRHRATVAQRNLDSLKEQVVEAVKDARKEHDLCLEGCNSFLEGLGLPTISKTWKGTVTRDSDGETILTVTGIEADDEYAAKSELESNFNVTATVNKITYAYDYVGEGEADWDEEEWEDREDEDDDSYADTHKDALTFSVEEE
jgi:hypothetical protein